MIIICDTNIWYQLGDERIDPMSIGENELAVTGLNLGELCSSEVIYTNPRLFIGALKAINKFADKWILEDPIDNILREIIPSYVPITDKYEKMKSTVLKGQKIDLESILNDSGNIQNLKTNIAAYNKQKEENTDRLNDVLIAHRANIKSNYTKKAFRKKDHVPEICLMFKDILEDRAGVKALPELDYKQFELIIFGWTVYFKEKTLDQSKCRYNDYEDLSHLGYVRPSMKYWTKDDKEPYRSLKKNLYAKEYFYDK